LEIYKNIQDDIEDDWHCQSIDGRGRGKGGIEGECCMRKRKGIRGGGKGENICNIYK